MLTLFAPPPPPPPPQSHLMGKLVHMMGQVFPNESAETINLVRRVFFQCVLGCESHGADPAMQSWRLQAGDILLERAMRDVVIESSVPLLLLYASLAVCG